MNSFSVDPYVLPNNRFHGAPISLWISTNNCHNCQITITIRTYAFKAQRIIRTDAVRQHQLSNECARMDGDVRWRSARRERLKELRSFDKRTHRRTDITHNQRSSNEAPRRVNSTVGTATPHSEEVHSIVECGVDRCHVALIDRVPLALFTALKTQTHSRFSHFSFKP